MRICFCDDEQSFHQMMKEMVQQWSRQRGCPCEWYGYQSAEEMLFENDEDFAFDLILLDIQMGKLDGVSLARKIRERDQRVMLAFLTAVSDHVFEGYEVQAARYLMKPVQEEKLFELLDLAAAACTTERKCLILDVSGEKKKIYLDEIAAVEVQGHYLVFHTARGAVEQKGSLGAVTEKLDGSFVMSHRSFCVNLAHLTRITRTECFLDTGESVPVSRGAYKGLNEAFIRYYKEEIL